MLLSVVIASYNRKDMLQRCLDMLSRQTFPSTDFEVIVVVDGSTDGTLEMLSERSTPYSLRIYRQDNQGQATALNCGIERATGQYCVFLDDDIIAEPGLLAAHARAQLTHHGIVGLGHLTRLLPPHSNRLARYLQDWSNEHYQHVGRQRRPLSFIDCFSGNLSAPRAALQQIGGFDTDLPRSFDLELGYRLQRHGLSFVYIPEAVAHQDYRKSLDAIIRDAEHAGVSGVMLYHRHPDMLPHLPLGMFSETSNRELLLRRLLLALRVPVRSLLPLGSLFLRPSRKRIWYRFVFGYCYWRGVRATADSGTWQRFTSGTPILRYHALGWPTEGPSRYVVPIRRFRRQMAWLRRRGYHTLTLEDFLCYRRQHRLPPARSVVITFDDGYADNHACAYPLLRHHNFVATIFLVTGAIGSTNTWDQDGALAGRRIMSPADIRAMSAGGTSFGAHTRTHPALPSLPEAQAGEEIRGSRRDLERILAQPVETFAYPYGQRDPATEALVERAGFSGAVGVHEGLNAPATPGFALRRTEIRGTDSLLRFALALWFGTRRWTLPGR